MALFAPPRPHGTANGPLGAPGAARLQRRERAAVRATQRRSRHGARAVQGLRSNVRTPTSTVRTLLGPTPTLILLLAQCSNTCQCCCWHTVRTHICVRAETSIFFSPILSIFSAGTQIKIDFEHFLTSSWQKLAPKTSPMCSNTS